MWTLYIELIGPIESLIKDKAHLIIVPTGALTSLPFHLLVTGKPAIDMPTLKELSAYRDAPWLIKRHAVSELENLLMKARQDTARFCCGV
jgi:CHAT domain-containing protein